VRKSGEVGMNEQIEKLEHGLMICEETGTELVHIKKADAEKILALLKEHEHGETFIVIDTKTGEEADTYGIALHEDWAKHLCYCDMEGWAIEDDGTLLLVDECGRFEYADRGRFRVKWE
jgi:hypothetical protein